MSSTSGFSLKGSSRTNSRHKDNISIPTITGVVKSSDVDKDCLITIDFKYMIGMSEEGGYLFNDYELVTDDCVLNRVLKI